MEDLTVKRHEMIYRKIAEEAKRNFHTGIKDYAAQAIKKVSEETGYSELTLRAIYYKCKE